jgi:DNA-binding MarR family transcriptional regulator
MCADATRKSAPSTEDVVDAIESAHATIESIFFDTLQSVLPHVASAEFEVMEVLFAQGVQRASAISEALSLAPSTLTRYCDQLAALGLITRERAPQDRRETLIDLTRKGRNATKAILSAQTTAYSARLGSIKAASTASRDSACATSPIWVRSRCVASQPEPAAR